MNSYSKIYLVKVPVAFLIRSDEVYKKDIAYGVIENLHEAAFESGDTLSFGEVQIEEVF